MEIDVTALPTADTQALLLLCARLGQHDENFVKPLSVRQYDGLAKWLAKRSLRPGDLLRNSGRNQLAEFDTPEVPREAIERLLDRGTALALLTESWTNSGLWVLGIGDAAYPERYKRLLEQAAPRLLYGVGDQGSLEGGGLAIVGSRNADEDDLQFARGVAGACAKQGLTVISGGAKGTDSEAMMAALDHGGRSVGVLPEGLGRAAVASAYHDALMEGRLTLISPFEPESRWFAFKAMERNKLIYALSDAALVVCASEDKGGTWSGATEALKQGRVPVFVRTSGNPPAGNHKLLQAGARAFSLTEPWEDLSRVLHEPVGATTLFDD
jgi:predicted Rossmann fold nucleotide-binding protein DprA/Smf involved in DNA uptake